MLQSFELPRRLKKKEEKERGAKCAELLKWKERRVRDDVRCELRSQENIKAIQEQNCYFPKESSHPSNEKWNGKNKKIKITTWQVDLIFG